MNFNKAKTNISDLKEYFDSQVVYDDISDYESDTESDIDIESEQQENKNEMVNEIEKEIVTKINPPTRQNNDYNYTLGVKPVEDEIPSSRKRYFENLGIDRGISSNEKILALIRENKEKTPFEKEKARLQKEKLRKISQITNAQKINKLKSSRLADLTLREHYYFAKDTLFDVMKEVSIINKDSSLDEVVDIFTYKNRSFYIGMWMLFFVLFYSLVKNEKKFNLL